MGEGVGVLHVFLQCHHTLIITGHRLLLSITSTLAVYIIILSLSLYMHTKQYALLTMMTNSSFNAIRTLKYGYNVIANARTFKTRLTSANAEAFFSNIADANRKHLCVYNTAKGYTFIAVVAHFSEAIWDDLAYAHGMMTNIKLRTKANKKLAIAKRKTDEANAILAWLPSAEPTPVSFIDDYNDELPF